VTSPNFCDIHPSSLVQVEGVYSVNVTKYEGIFDTLYKSKSSRHTVCCNLEGL
jgi:hypothetical protein